MTTYKQLQAKHEKEYNEFPFGWAFSKEQFEEMLDKHNWRGEKLLSIGGGGFIRSADEKALDEMLARHKKEMQEFRKNQKELVKGFVLEMRNLEYAYSESDDEVLSRFGYTVKDLHDDTELLKLYKKAINTYYKEIKGCL